ncbi:tumor necrosis factor receptor superfamily member 14-like isoform X1 [Acipenser ruthenus]|uniref:tumor necrosis factor receptor superfamily member 14-like isoform X1 n=1 Tax=Acipenser ruthenus TaxID=7906 RepID=UPI00274203DA|nr:tumor necrosis factor receptor superfamily member 14-like isoform X1 [Acipenser ruthenus]XP_058857857.1 tumor necrosis factor receptor superfamily member 14-like isoform X1 [Acipenser ruthenus]
MLSSFLMILFFVNIKTAVRSCAPSEFFVEGQCCPMCSPGSSVFRACTQDSSTSCIPCTRGTYTEEPNGLLKCFTCKNCDQALGLAVLHQCQLNKNTICGPLNGYFCSGKARGGGCDQGQKHTVCRAGERVKSQGTAESDTRCEDCPEGTFSTKDMSLNCTAWTDCELNDKVKYPEGSSTADVQCQEKTPVGLTAGLIVGFLCVCLVAGVVIYLKIKGTFLNKHCFETQALPIEETNPPAQNEQSNNANHRSEDNSDTLLSASTSDGAVVLEGRRDPENSTGLALMVGASPSRSWTHLERPTEILSFQ